MKPKIAFVVQRCGIDVNGGAEALCLSVAREMSKLWDITVITTCARDYLRWENHYPAGEDWIDDVRVLRFPVDQERILDEFDVLSHRMIGRIGSASLLEQEAWMRAQGPYSAALLRHLEDSRTAYDAFFFYTYLYATTYFGLPLVQDRAVLVPFAHDEWPIHMTMWDALFKRAQRIVFSTPEEREFLRERFRKSELRGSVIGTGITPPSEPSAERFQSRYGIRNSYVSYVGRIDEAKNCGMMIKYFEQFKHRIDDPGSALQLFLFGRSAISLEPSPYVRHFGFVDEETKWDALAGSVALIMPSHLESLSLVLLESWKVDRPVLVNENSPVLVGQTRRAQGGLWFSDVHEFGVALKTLATPVGDQLGRNGRRFVDTEYTWERVAEEYERVLESLTEKRRGGEPKVPVPD